MFSIFVIAHGETGYGQTSNLVEQNVGEATHKGWFHLHEIKVLPGPYSPLSDRSQLSARIVPEITSLVQNFPFVVGRCVPTVDAGHWMLDTYSPIGLGKNRS